MGGGVDFDKTSFAALQREFYEEIQAELTNIRYRGCLENIYFFEGKPGHEIVQVYECDFVDQKFYQLQELIFTELTYIYPQKALWVEISRCKSGELRLVPEQFLEFL
jgi:8-oxo-dGTP pyrophosphatase MutT (NUDIX family)